MNDIFLVCLGGSGSKILEAVVHMAAMGAWDSASIHVLMVDVDGGNGNVERATQTAELYQNLYEMNLNQDLFKSLFRLYKWTPTPQQINLLTIAQKGSSDESKLIASLLFSTAEHDMPINNGFRGHPNIGVLYMQKILSDRIGQPSDDVDAFIREAKESKNGRLMLAGSCFGGTGASCIPTLGRYLRDRIKPTDGMGLLAMLPTFSLEEKSSDPTDPNSDEFPNRVKTVLSTYVTEGVLDYRANDQSPIGPLFEKIYLLGSPKLIPFTNYASGTALQENPATFFDWFACAAIREYQQDPEPLAQGVYTAWLEQGPWDWQLFDANCFPGLQMKAAKLMIAVGLYMAELHTAMRDILLGDRKESLLEAYFDSIPTEERYLLPLAFEPFAKYGAMLVLWFYQIVTHLPENLFPNMGYNNHVDHVSPDKLQKQLKKVGQNVDENDLQDLYMLYYQKFFCPMTLFHMEQIRRVYWPRGNESDEEVKKINRDFLEAYGQIFKDNWGSQEEQSLGVLLPKIVRSRHYPYAKADRLMGLVYCDGLYDGDTQDAVATLLRRLFIAIDRSVKG